MTIYYLSPAGSDSNAGTSRGSGGAWKTISHAAGVAVAGDTINVLGVAGNAASYPTSGTDYTEASYSTPANGTQAAGPVVWIADTTGPMPTIAAGAGMLFFNMDLNWFEGLYLVMTGNSFPSYGVVTTANGDGCYFKNCTLNSNSQSGAICLNIKAGFVVGCDLYGGSGSPSFSSGAILLNHASYGLLIAGNRFHGAGDSAIDCVSSSTISPRINGNTIFKCAGDGIKFECVDAIDGADIAGNTIDANGGHGINVTGTAGISTVSILNNQITNHVGSGKYGINVVDGSTGLNDFRKRIFDYNNLYNNTSNYANVSAGAHDLNVNPSYVNPGVDFTPTNAAAQAAFPSGWIGAIQPVGGGGGGGPVGTNFRGGFVN